MKKIFKNTIVLLLVFGFFLSTNVLTIVKAATNILIPPTINYVTDNDTTVEKVELEYLRESNLKVYLMPDYTLEYVYYDQDIHYFDGEKYQEITSVIAEKDNVKIVKNNNYQVTYPNKINSETNIVLEYHDYKLSYTFNNINESNITATNEGQYSKVVYEDIMNQVNLEYYVLSEELKENIILNEYIRDFSISYIMDTNGLTLIKENEQLYLQNEQNTKIFEILPLYMLDENNNKSTNIETNITEIATSKYLITITPSNEYLESATYPVIIDPIVSITYSESSLSENSITFRAKTVFNQISLAEPYTYELNVGISTDEQYGIMELKRNTNISKSNVEIVFDNLNGQGTGNYDAYLLDSSYDFDELIGTSFPISDKTHLGQSNYTDDKFSVAYDRVFPSGQTTSVLVFIPSGEGSVDISSNQYGAQPIIRIKNVSYKNDVYTTFYNIETADIGLGSVNLANGRLTYRIGNYSFSHHNNPFNIEHVYSSSNRENIGYGLGWSINYLEYLENVNGEYSYVTYLNQASQKRTTFHKNSELGILQSVSNNDDVIKYEEGKYILYTEGITKVYEVLDIQDDSNAYLTEIKGNSEYIGDIRIKYELQNENVVIDKIIDGAGNTAEFTYNSNGYLSTIQYYIKTYPNPDESSLTNDSHKVVQYHYNGTLLEYIWKTDFRDSQILDQSNIKLEYSNNKLSRIYRLTYDSVYDDDPIEYQIGKQITYTDDLVSSIETYNPTNKQTKVDVAFYYGTNKAKVVENGNTQTYWFDIYGNILKQVDNKGNISTYEYDNTSYNQHNLIKQNYQPGAVYNYLLNPAFLNNDGWLIEEDPAVGSINKVQSNITLGQYQIELDRAIEGTLNYYQNVTLEPGRYIVSSNIKNNNLTGAASIKVSGTNIEIITSSNIINNSEDEYQKYYVEFEVPITTSVKISLESTSIGKTYFDYVSLNNARDNVVENLIENASFEKQNEGYASYWNGAHVIMEQFDNTEILGNNQIAVYNTSYVSQTINTSGFKGDKFAFSAYYYPTLYQVVDLANTYMEFVIEFNNADNTTSTYYINSSSYSEFEENFDVEVVYASIYAPKTYTSITIKMMPKASKGICYDVGIVDYLSLSKTTSDVTNLTDEIKNLPTTITLEHQETIEKLYDRYLNLSDTEQSLLTNKDTLLSKVTELYALEFTTEVNNLPTTITINEREEVEKVEELYNSLTEDELALITTTTKESYFEKVKQKNVCIVTDLINQLPETITQENYQEVQKTEDEYNSLSETEQQLIANYASLQTKIAEKNIIEVNDLISQLPTYDLFDDDNVSEVVKEEQASLIIMTEELYNALSASDQAQINDVLTLELAIIYKDSYINSLLTFKKVKVITKLENYGYDNQYQTTEENEYGGSTTYTYDTVSGLIEKTLNPLGNITEYEYIAFDYLQELKQIISDTTSSNVTYTYDKFGRIKTITKDNTTYTITYNILNEITKIQRGTTTILETTYLEENGMITTYVSNYIYNGTYTISYIYDDNKQIVEIKHNGITKYTNKYDLNGNLVASSTNDYTYYYIYSYEGILQKVKDTNGNIITYQENGKLIETFDKEYQINYNYDEEEVLINEVHSNLQISYSEQSNEDGEITSETIIYTDNNVQVLRKDTIYNNSIITSIKYTYCDKIITINYDYDLNGNIKNVTTNTYNLENELQNTKREAYTYDVQNQLSNHQVYNGTTQILNVNYTYDLYGNIQSIERNIKIGIYQTLPAYEEYVYNETYKDLLITKIEKESKTGTIINTYNYIYDTTNTNLTEVKKNNNTIETYTYVNRHLQTYTNENNRIEYKYNSEGIRYQKDIYDLTTNELIETRKYFLDGYKIIAEEISEGNDTTIVYYKYNNNEEVIGYTYETEVGSYEYTYLKNYQGDIIGIIDNDGEELTNYTYDAYGQVVEGTTISNSLLYRSYYYDTETSYYYLNSRYYNPQNGRFQIADEISYLGITGTINSYNLFSYCENEPVNNFDNAGYFVTRIMLKIFQRLLLQFIILLVSYIFMVVAALFDENIKNDLNIIRWNPFNKDEKAVLKASKVSFYKGIPVIQVANMGGSMSLGVIFFDKKQGIEVLKHERGHNTQFMMMGTLDFLIQIGIPSIWKNGDDTPWELSASILGNSLLASPFTKKQKELAMLYLTLSSIFGINFVTIIWYIVY